MCSIGPPLKDGQPAPLSETDPLPIYLDYNATTPVADEVWSAMMAMRNVWGNPSSSHPYGLDAKFALDGARRRTAEALGARSPDSIIFTSGGTESNNLAIIGGALSARKRHPSRTVVLLSSVEHPAVEEVANYLQSSSGFDIHRMVVNKKTGVLDVSIFKSVLDGLPNGPESVALITVMLANNEMGAINPIADLCREAKKRCGQEVLFHTDAAQGFGKVPVNVEQLSVDFLSVCGHKFYAPKGSGALYVRDRSDVSRILYGAGHEGGLRPGTENVLFASAIATALELVVTSFAAEQKKLRDGRDAIADVLRTELKKCNMDFIVNGDLSSCLPNTLNCAIFKIPSNGNDNSQSPVVYISAPRLISSIGHRVCLSAGSACHSSVSDGEIHISSSLKAVGADEWRAVGTLRISTGRFLALSEAKRAAVIIARAAAQQFDGS